MTLLPPVHERRGHLQTGLIMLLGFLALSHPAAAETLRIGFAGRVTSLDPHFFVGPANTSAAMHVFDPLLHRTPDGVLQPWLATSWQPVGDTAWEFHLRPDAHWHETVRRSPPMTSPSPSSG